MRVLATKLLVTHAQAKHRARALHENTNCACSPERRLGTHGDDRHGRRVVNVKNHHTSCREVGNHNLDANSI